MNTKEANLMSVLKQLMDHAHLSANALARKLNLPTPTINRLLTGEVKDPRISTLIAITEYFGIKIDQILGKEPLDKKFIKDEEENILISRPPMSLPILTITEATEYDKYWKTPTCGWLRWQNQFKDNKDSIQDNVFAVTIKNNLYEPIFNNGAYIIVNPKLKPLSGDYILVSFIGDSTATVKKYVAEGYNKYLYPLNSDLKIVMYNKADCTIIGVIIEAYINFQSTSL